MPEAFWQLSEFKMHHHTSHAIIRPALHLHDHQPVFVTPGNYEETAEATARKDSTQFAFLKYNDANPTDHCYHEFRRHFVFNKQTGKWTLWKRGGETTIDRVYTVNPKDINLVMYFYVLYLSKHAYILARIRVTKIVGY